ncbi:DUF6204 family protein [Nonomuraea recticatena]|uniref:DUF6204 family protein n=1 Tax=Nonomuraea recticatena TaxID=46178 RepID=UPI0031F87981
MTVFRVTIRGKFKGLDAADRAAVMAASSAAYTEVGAFTHDASVSAFTFRCRMPAGPERSRIDRRSRITEDPLSSRSPCARSPWLRRCLRFRAPAPYQAHHHDEHGQGAEQDP